MLDYGLAPSLWTRPPTTPRIKPPETPGNGANISSEGSHRVHVFVDDADPVPDECNTLLMPFTESAGAYMSGAINDDLDMVIASSFLSGQELPEPDLENYGCGQRSAPATDNRHDNFVAATLPSFRGQPKESPCFDLIPYKQYKVPPTGKVGILVGQSPLAAYLSDSSSKISMTALDAVIARLVPKIGLITETPPIIPPCLDGENKQPTVELSCPTCGKPWSNNEQDFPQNTSSTTASSKRYPAVCPEPSHEDNHVEQPEDLALPVISPLENLADMVAKDLCLSSLSQEDEATTVLSKSEQHTHDLLEASFDFGLAYLFSENESRVGLEEESEGAELGTLFSTRCSSELEGGNETLTDLDDESDLSSDLADWLTKKSTPASENSMQDGRRDSLEDFWEGGEPEYWHWNMQ